MVEFWAFIYTKSHYPQIVQRVLTSFFLIWMLFISLLCLIALTSTSNAIWKKSHESGHSWLVPDPEEKFFSFLLLSIKLDVGCSYMAFIMLSYIPSNPLCWEVIIIIIIIKMCWIVSSVLPPYIEMTIHLLFFIFHIHCFVDIEPSWLTFLE